MAPSYVWIVVYGDAEVWRGDVSGTARVARLADHHVQYQIQQLAGPLESVVGVPHSGEVRGVEWRSDARRSKA